MLAIDKFNQSVITAEKIFENDKENINKKRLSTFTSVKCSLNQSKLETSNLQKSIDEVSQRSVLVKKENISEEFFEEISLEEIQSVKLLQKILEEKMTAIQNIKDENSDLKLLATKMENIFSFKEKEYQEKFSQKNKKN